MMQRRLSILALVLLVSTIMFPPKASSQALPVNSSITFNSFSGDYYLSRDALGRSLLTAEEVILADFPSGARYYGITRTIPSKYQSRNIEAKILGITDAAGNTVTYKASSDKDGNLVIVTGDPDISLYGSQTFRIRYQARGVIDVGSNADQLLLNVNGRGWDSSFDQVRAVVHIPKDLQANLAGTPSCYIGYLKATSNDCAIETQKRTTEAMIVSKANNSVPPHHALVLKINFKRGTFTNKKSSWYKQPWFFAALSIAILLSSLALLRRSFKR